MADSAALLVEEVLPCKPLRQWVLSLPFALRFLLATNPQLLTQVLGIVYRTISGDLLRAAGRTRHGRYGCSDLDPAVGSALNLNIHLHVLFLDGVYVRAAVGEGEAAKPVFQRVAAPSGAARHRAHRARARAARLLVRDSSEASVRDRHRDLSALRWAVEGDREYRGA